MCVCVGGVCASEQAHVRGDNSGSGVRIILDLEGKVEKCPNFIHTHPFDNDMKKLCQNLR